MSDDKPILLRDGEPPADLPMVPWRPLLPMRFLAIALLPEPYRSEVLRKEASRER